MEKAEEDCESYDVLMQNPVSYIVAKKSSFLQNSLGNKIIVILKQGSLSFFNARFSDFEFYHSFMKHLLIYHFST